MSKLPGGPVQAAEEFVSLCLSKLLAAAVSTVRCGVGTTPSECPDYRAAELLNGGDQLNSFRSLAQDPRLAYLEESM